MAVRDTPVRSTHFAMFSLRAVATVLASALMALGLSVGAAMAEGGASAKPHYTPKGVCLLEDGTKK